MAEDLTKKRGRPKKNISNNKVIDKNIILDIDTRRELYLCLPHTNPTASNINIDSFIVVNDKHSDSESSEDLLSEIKKRDKIIREKTKELLHYKNIASNFNITTKNLMCYPLDMKLIDINSKKSAVVTKTNIVCWHDTEPFVGVPCFIAVRYDRGVYHVLGCFCSINCALAYNFNMNDHQKNERYSLTLNMYHFLITDNDNISIAHPKEVLTKYSGENGISIKEFRESSRTCSVKYSHLLPPCVPLSTYIEESRKKLKL